MPSNLLIDIGPAGGAHGERGIGRYVRGLAAVSRALPADLVERIWAFGVPGSTFDLFGQRAIATSRSQGLSGLPGCALARLASHGALRQSGSRVFHATDPQRPWIESGVGSLVTVYDLIPLQEPDLLGSWRPDYRILYRWYLRQIRSATRIVAISRTTAEATQERLGIAADRIDIVYPLVGRPPQVERLEPAEPTFLVVGALDQHKQPELVLQALARYRSYHKGGRLRVIGPFGEEGSRPLRALAGKLGISDSVALEGRIPDDELEIAYRSATALVSASRVEGFGLPGVEAVLRGLPVVAVETPAARETLAGAAALVPPDAEAIAEAMARPTRPSAEAVSAIGARFSAPTVAAALALSYRKVLD